MNKSTMKQNYPEIIDSHIALNKIKNEKKLTGVKITSAAH